MDNTKTLFIANWKSNMTSVQAVEWLKKFEELSKQISMDGKEVIIAPSYLSLPACYAYIKDHQLALSLAVQNISMFGTGAYTGEVNAEQAKEFADYTIIGHSERRTNLHESDEDIMKKTHFAKEAGLKTVVCVQNEETPIPTTGTDIIAYEPVFAIGTGNPDNPENIATVFSKIHEANPDYPLLYGGSVSKDTIIDFKQIPLLRGFLIGSASWDAEAFIALLSKW